MARNVKRFFLSYLAICTSSFEKFLFSSFAHFFIGSLIVWEFNFWASYEFWLLIPCQM
jgi:hypothetical protein